MRQRVGLLFGGRSEEYEVSLNSAATIARNFDTTQFEVIPIVISRTGKWYGPVPVEEIAQVHTDQYADKEVLLAARPGGELLAAADGRKIAVLDIIFPIVHGTFGEDGILQGLLELADIPYVGAGVASSAVGMDKLLMRKILAYHHLPQVRFIGLYRYEVEEDLKRCLELAETKLPYPMFVKPANGGSSVGISKVQNRQELIAGLQLACRYDRKILVEEGINAREIETSVLGNLRPVVATPGEIISSNDFYDYSAKYVDNKSICQIPAQLPEQTAAEVKKMALEAYKALDCEGFARIDFFIEKTSGRLYLNEINTLPGFTEISMYPKMWENDGKPIGLLLKELCDLACQRYRDRKKNSIHREFI